MPWTTRRARGSWRSPVAPGTRARVGGGGQAAAEAVVSIAIETGAYAAAGLDVAFVAVDGGPGKVAEALHRGQVDAAILPASAVVRRNAEAGADLALVLDLVSNDLGVLFALPEITRGADLRGRVLGCTARGNQDELTIRSALRAFGLALDRDVALVEVGARDALWDALVARTIAGFSTTAPLAVKADEEGYSLLYSATHAGTPYQLGCLAVTRGALQARRALLRALVAGTLDGCRRFKQDPALAIAHIARKRYAGDPVVARRTYDIFNWQLRPRPLPRAEAVAAVVADLAACGLLAARPEPHELIDTSLLAELAPTHLPLL